MARYAQESLGGGLDEGGGRFRYRIALQLSRALDNVSIAATIGFDMLANDFALELSRGTQPPADDSPIFSWEPPLEQACARHVQGTCMRMCMACAWRVHGVCMRVCMACAWRVHGVCMACASCAYGVCTVFAWPLGYLCLLEQADALLARSSPEMGLGLGSYINFRHSLEAGPLPAGLYYLDVLEERPRPGATLGLDALEGQGEEGGQHGNAAEHCHLFSLSISARAVPMGVPLLAQVVPAGARNLRVGEPLSLALHLSADFARPAAARGVSLLAALNAAGAATLRRSDGTGDADGVLQPRRAMRRAAARDGATLQLVWEGNQLAPDATYRLHVRADAFADARGVAFLNDTAPHLYRVGPAVGPELPEITPREAAPPSAADAANAKLRADAAAPAPGNDSESDSDSDPNSIALMREAAEAGAPLRAALQLVTGEAAPGGACSCEAGVQPVCVDELVLCACPLAYAGDRCERCALEGCNLRL